MALADNSHLTRQREFNRLYGNLGNQRKANSAQDVSLCALELFRRKIRESNLLPESYLTLANHLLSENGSGISPQRGLMGKYCLEKAHELTPHNISLLNNLINIKQIMHDETDLPYFQEALAFLNTKTHSSGKLKIGIRYLEKNNPERAEHYFKQCSETDDLDPEAFSLLTNRYMTTGNFKEAADLLARTEHTFANGNPFNSYFRGKYGQVEFLRGNYDKATRCFEQSIGKRPTPLFLNNLAELRARCGDREAALGLWSQSLQIDCLQIPLYLKMYDTVHGLNDLREESLENHAITVSIYTFNKLQMVKNTLESLAATEIGDAVILILENHCTDGTKEFLKTVRDLFPRNRLRVISLPTNIGAPAARNWLMAQPENRAADFTAFLDDDVILPHDWLKRLVGTMLRFPNAAVVGGKIVNQVTPKTLQYIYRFFDVVHETRLILSSKHPDEIDFGQFDFVRKCLSVMGCCHLLRTRIAREVGEFDIRFSPSQVDDIDHDILTCLKGYEIIYNGYMEVVHCQKSGKDAFVSRASLGNILGNDCKFAMKHETHDMQRLKEHTEELDRLDIKNKISELKKAGYLANVREVALDVI